MRACAACSGSSSRSTCAVYGVPVQRPDHRGRIRSDADHPLRRHQAGLRARAARLLPRVRPRAPSRCATSTRPAPIRDGALGEDARARDAPDPARDLTRRSAGGRGARRLRRRLPDARRHLHRDYIHVEDLARAHVLALERSSRADAGPFDAFNLGTGTGYSVKQVVDTVGRVAGKPVPSTIGARRPGDPPQLVAAPARPWKSSASRRGGPRRDRRNRLPLAPQSRA